MFKDYLPIQVDPVRLAESATELHGKFLLQDMPRLSPSLAELKGEVDVRAKFGVDRQNVRTLMGQVKASLTLQCQRCLDPFAYEITSEFKYGMVNAEEDAKTLPSSYDPVLVEEGVLNIRDMVEDELIVNLPIVPMHDLNACNVKLPLMVAGNAELLSEAEKDNPFKVIELLKGKPKQE